MLSSLFVCFMCHVYCLDWPLEREGEVAALHRVSRAEALDAPRGFQGCCCKDTVKGPEFEETKTTILNREFRENLKIVRSNVKTVSLNIPEHLKLLQS